MTHSFPTRRSSDLTPSYTGADVQRLVFLVSIPADVTWGSDQTLVRVYTSGSIARWEITKTSADNTRIQAFDQDDVEVENTLLALNMFGIPCAFSLWLQQDGADVDWQAAIFPLDGDTALAGTATIAGEIGRAHV